MRYGGLCFGSHAAISQILPYSGVLPQDSSMIMLPRAVTSHNQTVPGITSHNQTVPGITSHNQTVPGITSHNRLSEITTFISGCFVL